MSAPLADQRAYRIESIDLLRGLVIVIMALDHCRDFLMVASAQDPMANPDIPPALFFTRWITHLCAPVFVFLAGTSAGLMTARKSAPDLGRFLLTRGLWLIAVEVVLITTGWTFTPGGTAELGGRHLVIFQVIWALGASMVVLAGAQFLGRRRCLVLGALIVLGHNLLDRVWPAGAADQPWWALLHARAVIDAGPFALNFAYPLIPWIGVMLLGFGAAPLFAAQPEARRRALWRVGVCLIAAFILVRAADVYGDPRHWQVQAAGALATLMAFLNTSKYPPSLQYLLMTLGPAALICCWAQDLRGRVAGALVTLGRVPFAFYVLHIYLIHVLSLLLGVAQGFDAQRFLTVFIFFPKQGYGLGLPGVYLAWVLVVLMLYPLCRRMAEVKARRRDWWLSYI